MASIIKATYTTPTENKVFEVENTSLVDSIQHIQNDINKFLTSVMEEEKKLGITHPKVEVKEEEEEEEEEDEEEDNDQMEVDQKVKVEVKEEEDDEAQASKKQKIEA